MYFVEMKNHLVRRVDAKTGAISTVAGTGKEGFSGDGGPAIEATFSQPHSIGLDGDKFLYVADIGNHRIRRVDLKNGLIDTIAGNGRKELPRDGETAKDRPIFGPRALWLDRRILWIALREGHSIWQLDLNHDLYRHIAGTGKPGYMGDGGEAKNATFNGPKGIVVGRDGSAFVVDTENQAIRQILPDGKIRTIAGQGPEARGFAGDGGPATSAKLNRTHGICIGPGGAIYLGDSENHRVRRVRLDP
jgi:DNA-binding beta-propeller fold protein YncE